MGRRRDRNGLHSRISILISADWRDELARRARRQRTTKSQLLRDLLDAHFAAGLDAPRPQLPTRTGERPFSIAVSTETANAYHDACAKAGTTLTEEARYAISRYLNEELNRPEQPELLSA